MTKHNLKLVRQQRRRSPKPPTYSPNFPLSSLPPYLTPAERVEGARFRVLTIERAARQARVRRMIAQLQDLENAAA